MIKATAKAADGTTLLILGLEKKNLEMLRQGRPMLIDGTKLGIPAHVYILYGDKPMDIVRELKSYGLDLPDPKIVPGDAPR